MIDLLAYRPLWDPITSIYPDVDRYWLLLVVPLVIAVCLVYKGTRVREDSKIARAAGVMIVQVFIVMSGAAAVIYGVYALVGRLHG